MENKLSFVDMRFYLFFLRTTFTYLSGVATYLVAWSIFGGKTDDHLTEKNSMDFAVTYLVMIIHVMPSMS